MNCTWHIIFVYFTSPSFHDRGQKEGLEDKSTVGMNEAIKFEKSRRADKKKVKGNYASVPTHEHTYVSPQGG